MHPMTALNIVSPSLRPVSLLENEPQRLMETRLMFHYTRVVCHEMPDCNPQATKVMWKEAIPQIGFSFSIVLDPLLALSAMHLHSFTPTDSQLPMVISFYLDLTLAKYRELIPQIDGDLAEPLFLAAVMLRRITWSLSHRRAPDGASAPKLPLQTYHMLRGLETLSLRKMDYLTGLGYSYFARGTGNANRSCLGRHIRQTESYRERLSESLQEFPMPLSS
jgi:hypothetical protein